ncbi:hypothetical protein ACN06F_09230 [Vreelandella sp. 21]|uniref:hypothetical protein n=1 Tax=Vreelandella sp. 21 TaxID=3402864 RepID=UPI003D9A491C
MDSESLAKLQRLKQEMQRQPAAPRSGSSRLSPDDFKVLAKTMGVAEYADAKIRVKKRKKPKINKKKDERSVAASLPKQPKKKKEKLNPADSQPKPKRNDWIRARCTICRATFSYLPEWNPKPVLCEGCRNERKNTAIGKRGGFSQGPTNFTSVSVFQGGSPGGGKRR